ncbi:hypothetical protein [Natronorubrum sp. DTA28]|uniref:hypothetical protein n=1 Tax=Natronorubrum sp. DTA28 TaxID=3447019 RepID=UPI003F8382C4
MGEAEEIHTDSPKYPSGDLSLDEARRRYDEEERRRENIETKIRLVLTANTIFISVGILILEGSQALAAVFPSIVSTIIGLGIIFPKSYNSPISEGRLYNYARLDRDVFHDEVLLAYIVSIDSNKLVNDLKMDFLKFSMYLSSSTLGLVLLSYWADLEIVFLFVVFVLPILYTKSVFPLLKYLISTVRAM